MKIYTSFLILFYKVVFLVLLVTISCIRPIQAQVAESSELFKTLVEKDSLYLMRGLINATFKWQEILFLKILNFITIQDRVEFFKLLKKVFVPVLDENPYK